MATISTVTIGSDTFSVYNLDNATAAETNLTSYWNGRLGEVATAVAAASDDDKKRALVMASDWLDRASNFTGTKTSASQPRAWPRDNATNSCLNTTVTDGTTPDDIANIAFFLAGLVVSDPAVVDAASQGSNIKRAKAGSAEVEFFQPTIGTASDVRLPVQAHDAAKCYFGSQVGVQAGSQSGADTNGSDFCPDDFERSDGFA